MCRVLLLAGALALVAPHPLAALDKEAGNKNASSSPEANAAPKAAGADKKRPKSVPAHYRACTLHITWWDEPPMAEGERLELAYQVDTTTTPFLAGAMQVGNSIDYVGPATVTIVRRIKTETEIIDSKGKPVKKISESWVPFASCALPDGSEDNLILLMMIPGKPLAIGRAFDIALERFPFGSFHILNFTKARVGCNLGGKVFFAEPGKRSPSPMVMTQRQVVNFRLAIFEASGEQRRLYSTPIILDERTRRLYFVTEYPGNEIEQRYDTRTLVDFRIDQPTPSNDTEVEKPQPKVEPKATKKAAAVAQ